MLGSTLRRLPLVLLLTAACARGPEGGGDVVIEVAGATRTLARAEFLALPVAEVTERGHVYTGVRLRDLLRPDERSRDTPLVASGADGYTQTLAPEVLDRADALVVHAVDDGPLAAGEGPLRLVVAGSPGLSVRQLVRLARP